MFTFWDDVKLRNTRIIHDPTSLPWHIGKNYDELKQLHPGNYKKNELSWVTSNATNKEGHRLRMSFLAALQANNFPLHLYGRGFQPIDDKFDGIFPYKYSLAIENYSCNDYWTEKLADCFLSWTLPFYYGCTNVLNYFPADSIIAIDPADPDKSMRIIQEAIQQDAWQQRLNALEEARNLVLERYQFFPALADKIRKANLTTATQRKLIPGCTSEGLIQFSRKEQIRTQIVNLLRR